jgi:hypothetical protein
LKYINYHLNKMEIKGYNNYTIVYNKKFKRDLKSSKDKDGYLYVRLYKDGKGKAFLIHRLVAINYIENPENKKTVDHIDRNILNNNVSNLRWATTEEQNRNRLTVSNTGFKYISIINKRDIDYYRIVKHKVFEYNLRYDKWTLEEAVEIRDCLCRRHDVPVLDWID